MTLPHQPHWGQAGSLTYYPVVDGRIIAILHWEDEWPTQLDGPYGDLIIAEAGWCWVPVDKPSAHHSLHEAPMFEDEMEHEDLVRVHEGALDVAQREIVMHLGLGLGRRRRRGGSMTDHR